MIAQGIWEQLERIERGSKDVNTTSAYEVINKTQNL